MTEHFYWEYWTKEETLRLCPYTSKHLKELNKDGPFKKGDTECMVIKNKSELNLLAKYVCI